MTSPSNETPSVQSAGNTPFSEDENRTIMNASTASTGNSVEYLHIPLRSASCKKNHRAMKLANGLTAVLIADSDGVFLNNKDCRETNRDSSKDAIAIKCESNDDHRYHYSGPPSKRIKKEHKMAECRMSIDVGNANDPPDFPGIARLLEHVIAMGTNQYPQHFNDFVSDFGGWFNAYTGSLKSTFKIAVPEEFLSDVLQRLARFFVPPFIAIESVIAVAPQFVTLPNYANDKRLYDVLETFWKCRYRAHNTTIAIEANLELDTLQRYVTDSFSIISSAPLPDHCFGSFKATDLINITGVQKFYGFHLVHGNNNKLEFVWTMPLLYEYHRSRPLQYISTILGHKGKGSLASYLQTKNWCLNLSCEVSQNRWNYSLVTLSLTTTNEGSTKMQEIIRTVHSYINMLRKEGPDKRIYEEMQKIEAAAFRYSDESRPLDKALHLCENIDIDSPANYPNDSEEGFEYDPVSIKACIDALTPENGNIITFDRSDRSSSQKIEPWFKTQYTVIQIGKSLVKYWKNATPVSALHLPETNAFIAEDFSLIDVPEDPPQHPTKIFSNALLEVWHKPDVKLELPKCHINFYFISPLPLALPENAVMLDMFVAVLNKLLFEPLYPATVAGLYYDIQSAEKGLLVKVSGYNQKLPLLLKTITKHIAHSYAVMTEGLYNLIREKLYMEYYHNRRKELLLQDLQLSLRRLVHWSALDKFAATALVKFDRFQQFAKYFTESLYVQCLVQGNMAEAEATEIAQKSITIFNCRRLWPNTWPQLRTVEIPRGMHYCRVKVFESRTYSTVSNYYQFDGDSIEMTVMIELLNMIIQDSSFDTVALDENMEIRPMSSTFGVHGYSITKSSKEYGEVEEVDNAIEMLRQSLFNVVRGMTDEDLISVKESLMNEKIRNSTVIDQEEDVKSNWNEIISGQYSFDKPVQEIDILRELRTETMRTVMIQLTENNANTRKLSVQTIGELDLQHREAENANAETDGISGNGTPTSIGKGKTRMLTYITALHDEPERPGDCYITDIESYKRNVMIVPVHGCNT